jgi:hypothetical protein
MYKIEKSTGKIDMTLQGNKLRMASSGTLRRVALVRTDISEERSASFIRVTRFGKLGITLAVTSNRRTLQRNTCIFFTADTILRNHKCQDNFQGSERKIGRRSQVEA